MNRVRKLMLAAFACITAVMLLAPPMQAAPALPDPPLSAAGMLDVRTDTSEYGTQFIPLHGEWMFYWKQLLAPADFASGGPEPTLIEVPLSWKHQLPEVFGGEEEVRYGYGTYRLLLTLPPEDVGRSKGLYIRSVASAYRIWIDGEERQGLGKVGTNRAEETPQDHTHMIFIKPEQATIEIVMQVSNYSFREGGIISEVVYGDTTALIVYLLKKMFLDMFIIGGLLLLGLYHFIIYTFRRKNLLTLLVGLVATAVAARTLFLNGYISRLMLGVESWELLTKLEYLAENFAFLFLVLLIRHMYPQEVNRYFLLVSYGTASVLSTFVLLAPARIFTETMLLQTSVKAVILVYFVIYVGFVAYLRKREGALINLSSIVILILTMVNDMLYYARILDTVELLNFSVIGLVLAQAMIVSYRYNQLAHRNDRLVTELAQVNASLEQRVQLRTQKLREANEQLHTMKDARTKMLVNIAHDLNSPMTGMQSYLHLMDRGLLNKPGAIRQMVDKAAYIQRLIRDLFELAKLETREQALELETVLAVEWLEELFRHFAADVERVGFALHKGRWELPEEGAAALVAINRYRMLQVMQNYMDNAIKFSQGHIKNVPMVLRMAAYTEPGKDGARLVVEVTDQGEGIAEDELPYIFNRFYKKRTNNEGGSGLGLAIVAEIVAQHHGTVGVRSVQGEGSTFLFTLPLHAANATGALLSENNQSLPHES